MSSDIRFFQEFGGEKIVFEKEETSTIKRIVDQGTVYIMNMSWDTANLCNSLHSIT